MPNRLLRFFKRDKQDKALEPDKKTLKTFKKRYAHFRKLLDANAKLAELMADMDVKLNGNTLFGFVYINQAVNKALYLTKRMATNLQGMNPVKHSGLTDALENIEKKLALTLVSEESKNTCTEFTFPLSEINLSFVDCVGGKSANLGEMLTKAKVPVPKGFAISISAYHAFMQHDNLEKILLQKLDCLNIDNREELVEILQDVRNTIEKAPLPPELEEAIYKAWDKCFEDKNIKIAVRSSALAEDGEKSFAGQFISELNISRDEMLGSYKRVIASVFSTSATMYRIYQGIPMNSSSMAVACLEMVQAKASGVAYSHDPVNLLTETVVINGVWGLGKYAVDGIVPPDMWIFTRSTPHSLVRRKAGLKDRMLTVNNAGELVDKLVETEKQKEFCLSDKQAQTLTEYVMALEKNYGTYQDVEWAKDYNDKLVFLQSRPLDTRNTLSGSPKPPLMEHHELLAKGEDIACQGIATGTVVKPLSQEDLKNLPANSILVTKHSSAEYAQVMDKVQAVIAENGGITGHMATICREFKVPCILNVPNATQLLKDGMQITIDGFNGYIYRGTVEELLPLRLQLESVRLHDTPILSMLKQISSSIIPLNLVDPNAANFTPGGCKTLHDIMRYAHEHSYTEMFAISDSASSASGVSLKLNAPLPIDLYLIDLDGGTTAKPSATSVKPEEIVCAPLKAMLKGMLRPDTMFRKPRPINMGGFLSVMGQQLVTPQGGERFGDKSYAIISDRYMNFSSRVGYHYSVLDAYCGNTDSKNYISFTFQGGAAGEARRERRCRAIALVLEELDFNVTQQGDMVKSRLQKYKKEFIEDRMDQLGRLLQVTRQMDMLMVDEASIVQFKDDFMNGIYH